MISSADASPSAIRGGIVIGALKGMNDVTRASVPSGLSSTANARKNETRISIVSGVIEDVAVDVERPGGGRGRQPRRRDHQHLAEAEDAEPDDLAGQQVARPD